ncbi:MAG: hypothetical protein U1E65_32030 [Myxococcota bacterium]
MLILLALGGCQVAPRQGPELPHADASVTDAGKTGSDAGVSDAGPGRCDRGTPCASGYECARDGVCRTPASPCTTTEACAAPSICVDGVCGSPPGACTVATEAECGAHRRCSAVGYCEPALSQDENLDVECSEDGDCGIGGRCRFGICTSCLSDSDCPSPKVCGSSGRCEQPFLCARASDCFAGNVCVQSACQPAETGCRRDTANDVASGASPLTDTASTTPSICGPDVDWYKLSLDADQGAELIVRTDPRQLSVAVDVYSWDSAIDGSEVTPSDLVHFALPGLDVVRIPTSTAARSLAVKISALDVAGAYTIDLRKHQSFCAGDVLDIYGDESRLRAPRLPRDARLALVACPGDVDAVNVGVERGDLLLVKDKLSGSDGQVTLSMEGPNGLIAGPLSYTLSTTTALAPSAAAASTLWTINTVAGSVPSLGQPYELSISSLLGTRIEACRGATVVAAGSTPGTLAGATDVGSTTCGFGSDAIGPDRVAEIVPPRAGALLHATVRSATAANARFSLSVLTTCTDDASTAVCDAPRTGTAASLELLTVSTAPLYLWISARSATVSTAYVLDVAWDEPGDYTCRFGQGVQPILASGDLRVDTTAATDTVHVVGASACGGDLIAGDGAGPDRFLSLELGAHERAALDLVGPYGGLLWVSNSCGTMESGCVGSALSRLGHPGRVVLQPTVATSYLIAVDGLSSDIAGPFTVHALLRPQCLADTECMAPSRCDDGACVNPPANDACDGTVVPLSGGAATIHGSTGAANDSFASNTCQSSSAGGQDVVYAIDVPSGVRELRARISSASWDPILSIRRGTCPTATAEVACSDDASLDDLLPDVRVQAPSAGRYFVIVDAYAGSGPFTLEITAR